MAYGDLKVRNLIWNTGSGDNTVILADIPPKNNPTFTGVVTVPTAPASDVSTKAASTAFVDAYYATKAAPAFTGSATGVNLTLSGNLVVNGTTTTIDSVTLSVKDKNIELGVVSSPSDTTADGGGITLKGASDKTFNWVNATDAWTSSEHIYLGDNKKLLLGVGAGGVQDLQIYSNGTEGILEIPDGGTLKIKDGSNTMATFSGASNQLDIHVQTVFIGASSNASWDKANNRFSGTITEINVTANNSTDETVYPLFADGATGSQGAETDTGLTYNPSTGELTATKFVGAATALDGSRTIGGVVFDNTGNIDLPGVNTAGNQNTTGTSGGFTAGSASNLNSGTLPAARINGLAFDGSNITNLPATGGTFTGTASGSLTAGQVVFLNSSGQLKKPSNTITANNPVDVGTFVGIYTSRTTFQPRAAWDTVNKIGVNWAPSSSYNNGSNSQFYLTPFTLDESSTPALMVMGSQTSASSANSASWSFQCICVGQPTSTTSRFLAVWKQTNNYSVAQCFDTNGSNSLQFVGSQVQVGHLGYGYRVYSDPQGICKTGTAGQYLWQGYNASAARGGVELLTVDASGNVTRGNSLETDAAHGNQSDKNSSCFYDPDADRVIVWWQHESSPHYHNWTNFRVNGASLTKNSSSNIGAYCTSTVCSFDDTLNKFCMVICDQTNNRQAVLIGNATSSGLSYTTTQIFNSNNWSSEASGTIDANSGRVIVSYAQSGNTSPLNIQSAPLSGNSPGTWTTAANLPSYLMSKYHWHGQMINIPHLSELMFFVHQYNSSYSYRRAMEYGLKVAVVSTDLTADNFLGISQSSGSGTRTVDVISAINTQVSGLTVGAKYYAQGDGTIATSPDGLAGSIPIGMALASNKLLIKH